MSKQILEIVKEKAEKAKTDFFLELDEIIKSWSEKSNELLQNIDEKTNIVIKDIDNNFNDKFSRLQEMLNSTQNEYINFKDSISYIESCNDKIKNIIDEEEKLLKEKNVQLLEIIHIISKDHNNLKDKISSYLDDIIKKNNESTSNFLDSLIQNANNVNDRLVENVNNILNDFSSELKEKYTLRIDEIKIKLDSLTNVFVKSIELTKFTSSSITKTNELIESFSATIKIDINNLSCQLKKILIDSFDEFNQKIERSLNDKFLILNNNTDIIINFLKTKYVEIDKMIVNIDNSNSIDKKKFDSDVNNFNKNFLDFKEKTELNYNHANSKVNLLTILMIINLIITILMIIKSFVK